MALKTEGNRPGDVLLFEEGDHYSREEVTIAAGADLKVGAVLGKVTASGKYILRAPAAVDGSQVAAAVLLQDADAAAADVANVIVVARHARVKRAALVHDATVDNAAKRQTAVDELAGIGILTDV